MGKKLTVIFVRHGRDEYDKEAETFVLSEQGKIETGMTANLIKSLGYEPTLVLTAAATRAIQSAEILCKSFNANASDKNHIQPVVCASLNPLPSGKLSDEEKQSHDFLNETLRQLGPDHKTILAMTHEKKMWTQAFDLSGKGVGNIDWSSAFKIEFDVSSWDQVQPASADNRYAYYNSAWICDLYG